jgi:hypothetical protein
MRINQLQIGGKYFYPRFGGFLLTYEGRVKGTKQRMVNGSYTTVPATEHTFRINASVAADQVGRVLQLSSERVRGLSTMEGGSR